MSTGSEVARRIVAPRARGLGGPVLAALVGFLAADSFQVPQQQIATRAALLAVDAYRATLSPFFAHTHLIVCRFHPTCSEYGRQALVRYGIPRGLLLAAGRVLRCQPLAKGGEDPVP